MDPAKPHYILTFDGGSKGNPGPGYGSYEILTCDGRSRLERKTYGDNITNNEAEYRTLIEGLGDILTTLRGVGKDPRGYRVRVQGDSQLVIRQLIGEYQVRHPGMKALYRQAKVRCSEFGAVEFVWHARSNSVRTLGH